ncbi:MAG: hypothetical protein KDK07_18205 [Bauldia sp.]|nr:hypothetical protein [Bauldia sp.]
MLAVALALGLVQMTPSAVHAGIEPLTSAENPTIPSDTVVIRLTGMIEPPMAKELEAIWTGFSASHGRMLIDLDSPGGSFTETEALIDAIANIREGARVDTLVRHGAMCASACIAVFVQGEDRAAGGASVWLIHGACRDRATNVPSLALTDLYLDMLRDAGVSEAFLCELVAKGYVTTPGKLWISGYELVHVYHANIITRLLEPWRPEPPWPPIGAPTASQ